MYPFSLNASYRPDNSEIDGMVPFVTRPRLLARGPLGFGAGVNCKARRSGLRTDISSIYAVLISSRYGVRRVFVSQLHCAFTGGCIVSSIYRSSNFAHQVSGNSPSAFVLHNIGDSSWHFLEIRANVFTDMTPARTRVAGLRGQT